MSFPQLTDITERAGICRGSVSCPSGYGCTFSGEIGMANCNPVKIKTETGYKDYGVECNLFKDAPIRFTTQEWNELVNTPWPGYDLTLPVGGGNMRTFKVYGTPDYKLMFFRVGNVILEDAPVNYMLGLRWFFKDPNLKYSKLVVSPEYNLPNREVVLYEIRYELNEGEEENVTSSLTNTTNLLNP